VKYKLASLITLFPKCTAYNCITEINRS